jgi:hypothetical protein
MTHLTPQQFTDAIDGALAPVHEQHVQACEACRIQVASLRSLAAGVRAVGAPEPSPLFWDHLSERVRAATSAEAIPAEPWWHGMWNPAMTIGLAVATMAVVFVVRSTPSRPAPIDERTQVARSGDAGSAGDDESLAFVARVASTLDTEDLHQAAQPTPDGVDAALSQLNDEQRAALVRLLRSKMGSGE